MSVYIVVSIGNSDDKLTQKEWHNYVDQADTCIRAYAAQVHFFGGSENWKLWQNVTWTFNCDSQEDINNIRDSLIRLKNRFNQDSVAWMEGTVRFLA